MNRSNPRLAWILGHPRMENLLVLRNSEGKVVRKVIYATGSSANQTKARKILIAEARALGYQVHDRVTELAAYDR